jgi:hypothetical protein
VARSAQLVRGAAPSAQALRVPIAANASFHRCSPCLCSGLTQTIRTLATRIADEEVIARVGSAGQQKRPALRVTAP